MSAEFTMDAPDKRRRLDEMKQGIIGTPIDRPDGPLKVSGRATYAHEYPLDDIAFGVLVRAPFAKGKVTGLEKAPVEALAGILGVISDERFACYPAQGTANEAPVQGNEKVAYFGQPIALVVAETFEQARHGAQMLAIGFNAEEDVPLDPEAVDAEPQDDSVDQGDLDKAMDAAEHSIDATYTTPSHAAAAMEPHCAIALWDDDELTLYGAYQMLKFNVNELADALGIESENVRIHAGYVGGGFGSKLGISQEAVSASIAAKALGRPVCVNMTRQQVFESILRRSETRQRIRLAADADGRITGIGHESRVSNLPGEDFAEPVPQSTHYLYGGDNRKIALELARVHRTPAGSVRAPGEAVGMPVLECAIDELAEKIGIDPVELRKQNLPDHHPEEDIPYASRLYAEAMDEGADRFGWAKRNTMPGGMIKGDWMIGHGMAGASRVNLVGEAEARVTLSADGDALVETDMTDIGTGTYAVLTQIAGEMLGLPADRIETRLGDSALPKGPGSGGSWGASSSGSAVFVACEAIRRTICEKIDCDEKDLTLKDGEAIAGNRRMTLTELLDGEDIVETGLFKPGEMGDDYVQSSYGAYFCEVAVNRFTGETRVRRMTGVFAAGRILNEKTATSQCYGGMIWGIGMALTEALIHDPRDGHVVNRDLAEYHIPVNADVPQIEVVLLDERDDIACPLQSKGIGELGLCGAAGSVINAIYNATGVRVRDFPATLDKILGGLPAT